MRFGKKELRDAVIGVEGVLVIWRGGGELGGRAAWLWSVCNRAILFTVGVLNGPTVSGGRFIDLKFLRGCADCGCDFSGCALFSGEAAAVGTGLRALFRRCTALAFSWIACTGPDRLPVDVLRILLESSAKFDFLLSKKCISAGDSFGDSYTFGIAGTGGTSSSSSVEAGMLVIDFGAGSREPVFWGRRGCNDPVDVLTVLLLASEPTENPEL